MDLLLMNDIELYKEKKAQKEALEAELKEMNNKIVEAILAEGMNKVETPNGVIAQVVTKENIKYENELSTHLGRGT